MEAGAGADEQARRLARKVEDLRDELARAERQQQAWEIGAAGERMVAQTLSLLSTQDWRLLHDVHWPGRPRANIDHVVTGPTGVFVMDTKNWGGDVVVRDGVLRQNGYPRSRETAGVSEAAAAVTAILKPGQRNFVRAVLVLAGSSMAATTTRDGITVCGEHRLLDLLTTPAPTLGGDRVGEIHALLRDQLAAPSSPALLTSRALEQLPPAQPEPPARSRRRPTAPRTHPRRNSAARGRPVPAGLSREPSRLVVLAVVAVLVLSALPALASAFGHAFAERVLSSTTTVHPTPSMRPPTR